MTDREEQVTPQRCPICGDASEIARVVTGMSYVICDNCGTAGPFADTEEEAVFAWNRLTVKE
jgi:Lar family restriction alleviation protein